MTNPEIPEEAVDALMDAIIATPREFHTERVNRANRDRFRAALEAALPHLRVQETPMWVTIEDADDDGDEPWPSGLSPDNPNLTPQAEYIHVHSNGPDPADCTTCEPPHPRPVVDREALRATIRTILDAIQDRDYYGQVDPHPDSEAIADAVLALLPTEEATKALVETAGRLGCELGRKEALTEAADRLTELAQRIAPTNPCPTLGLGTIVRHLQDIASQPSGAASTPRTHSDGHTDLPPDPEGRETDDEDRADLAEILGAGMTSRLLGGLPGDGE